MIINMIYTKLKMTLILFHFIKNNRKKCNILIKLVSYKFCFSSAQILAVKDKSQLCNN